MGGVGWADLERERSRGIKEEEWKGYGLVIECVDKGARMSGYIICLSRLTYTHIYMHAS